MKRYQIYLDPHTVSILDEYGEQTDISRSQLIQMAVDQVAQNLRKIFISANLPVKKEYLLDALVGAIQLKDSKITHYAEQVDDIYLQD